MFPHLPHLREWRHRRVAVPRDVLLILTLGVVAFGFLLLAVRLAF
jgi:hypothetical protein